MLWGGIGGVVGGLYALWYHVADRQDFDKHYSMWYYVQPLMGLVLGAITFLILAGGFLIVQVNITDPNAAAGARLIPYLVAVLAGFKQDFVYDQLERVVSIFAPGPAKAEHIEVGATGTHEKPGFWQKPGFFSFLFVPDDLGHRIGRARTLRRAQGPRPCPPTACAAAPAG